MTQNQQEVRLYRVARIHPRHRTPRTWLSPAQLISAPVRRIRALSMRRRIAATLPLVVALSAWAAIPSYASTYNYDLHRVNGIIANGHECLYTDKGTATSGPRYRCADPGYNFAGDFVFHRTGGDGPATLYGYCVNLELDAQPDEVLSDSGSATAQESYIVNNYFPYANHAGALGDNDEAAAVQIAIWGFTNGTLSAAHPPTGLPSAVVSRAHAIYDDAADHAAAWYAAHTAAPSLSLTTSGSPATLPGATNVTVTAHAENPAHESGLSVTFHIAGEADRTVALGTGDTATITLTRTTPGKVDVSAGLKGYTREEGGILVPNTRAQSMAFARHLPASAAASASATWVTPPPTAAPHITKSVSDAESGQTWNGSTLEARPGDHLTFTLQYSNSGNAAINDAVVTDDLAQNNLSKLIDVAPANGGVRAGTVISWHVGTVAAGGSGTVAFAARIPQFTDATGAGMTFCNVGTLTPGGQSPPAPVTSNQVCVHATTQPQPHVTASKTVDGMTSNTASLGETLTYAITVTNDGNRDLSNLAVTDQLTGNNLDMLVNVTPKGGTFDAATRTVTWSVPALGIGTSTKVTFTADLPSHLPHGTDTCFINAGSVSGGGVTAITNTVSTCVHPEVCTVPSPVITITGPGTLSGSENIDYTVTAKNGGAAQLSPNTVAVTLPAGFTYVSSTPTPSAVAGQEVSWVFATLAPAQSVTITVTATTPATVSGDNVASVAMTSTDNSNIADCPHPQASVSATTVGSVPPPTGAVQGISTAPSGGVQAISVPGGVRSIATPNTGAASGIERSSIVGICLMLSGLIVLTGRREKRTPVWGR